MLLPLLVLAALGEAKTVIAAVGDSVTAGDHGLPPFASDDEGNYPFFLQGLLDDAYPGQFEVANLGLSGATASPSWRCARTASWRAAPKKNG